MLIDSLPWTRVGSCSGRFLSRIFGAQWAVLGSLVRAEWPLVIQVMDLVGHGTRRPCACCCGVTSCATCPCPAGLPSRGCRIGREPGRWVKLNFAHPADWLMQPPVTVGGVRGHVASFVLPRRGHCCGEQGQGDPCVQAQNSPWAPH